MHLNITHGTGTNQTVYLLKDHLGSTETSTNSSGSLMARLSYDAWGRRRNGDTWNGNPTSSAWTAITNTTRHGFTSHEMLDNLNLVYMNGRVYDQIIGRFLSADPFIDGPGSTQGWNRYSYVHNNPLSYIDPSGYKSILSSIGDAIKAAVGLITRGLAFFTFTFGNNNSNNQSDGGSANGGSAADGAGGGGGGGNGGRSGFFGGGVGLHVPGAAPGDMWTT